MWLHEYCMDLCMGAIRSRLQTYVITWTLCGHLHGAIRSRLQTCITWILYGPLHGAIRSKLQTCMITWILYGTVLGVIDNKLTFVIKQTKMCIWIFIFVDPTMGLKTWHSQWPICTGQICLVWTGKTFTTCFWANDNFINSLVEKSFR